MPSVDLFRLSRIAIVYFVLAALALKLTRYDGGVAFLWIATAYLIAEMSLVARRHWLGILATGAVAGALATGLYGFGWAAAIPMAIANTLEAWIAAYYVRRHAPEAVLTSLNWLARFALFAALIPPLFSASIASLVAFEMGKPVVGAYLHFFLGHALGNLAFAPIFVVLLQGEIGAFCKQMTGRRMEMLGLLGLSFAATLACFAQSEFPLLFLPVLPIILVTFRLGRGGAVIAILFLTLVGGGLTLADLGPVQLIAGGQGFRLQFFQFYLAMTVLTAWPVAADLSNRSRLHRKLRVSEARYRLLADHSSDILMQLGTDGRIRYVSPSVRQLGGYIPSDLIGTEAGALIAPDHRQMVREYHLATIERPAMSQCFEYEALTEGGEKRWFETHSQAIVDDQGRVDGTLSIIRDVSSRKSTETALTIAAMTDSLTGLANRRAFRNAVEARTLERRLTGSEDCIAILDVDHFKRVNDRHGHDAGDEVLRNFARIARSAVREGEMIARMGGEEFAILFANTSIANAQEICERLRAAIAASVTIVGGKAIRVTVSGGVAAVGQAGFDDALKTADIALYQAKSNGRDQLAIAA